jgi:hypothetical protein
LKSRSNQREQESSTSSEIGELKYTLSQARQQIDYYRDLMLHHGLLDSMTSSSLTYQDSTIENREKDTKDSLRVELSNIQTKSLINKVEESIQTETIDIPPLTLEPPVKKAHQIIRDFKAKRLGKC